MRDRNSKGMSATTLLLQKQPLPTLSPLLDIPNAKTYAILSSLQPLYQPPQTVRTDKGTPACHYHRTLCKVGDAICKS